MNELIIIVISSLCSAYLSAYFTSKRFISEKWWEKKTNAYIEVIECLSNIDFYYTSEWNNLTGSTYMNSVISNEYYKKYIDSKAVLNKYITSAGIFISQDVADIIERYLSEHEVNKPCESSNDSEGEDVIFNDINKQFVLIGEVICKVREMAKKDLKLTKSIFII